MSNLTGKKIFDKVEFPPCGFILQKDVYTTNLLYANDQFPLTALKKRLPFRPKSGKKIQNPNHSVRILRENGNVSENSESKKLFYLLNNFKPKQLKNKKLKFPLPKLKAFPLSHLNLYEEISKKDLRIRNIDDDLNITSNNGRKIFYKFKEKKLTNPKIFKKKNGKKINENMKLAGSNNIEIITRNSFNIITLIGTGGFSKVWEVKWKKNGKIFAMKEMSKATIIDRKTVKSVLVERDILSTISHPFIVNLHFAFQDNDKLYLVVDLVKGKDLRTHLYHLKQMNEEQTKFVTGCVILGLEYIHYNKIVHRDIKPENIILDEKGYAKLTDFGLATQVDKIETKDTPGTYSYMAPEILFREYSNLTMDYYSLGIIVYELMKGIRPYIEFNANDTKKYLSENQFSMKRHAVPEGWGIEIADFINKLFKV